MHRTIGLSACVALLAVTGSALASPYSDAVLADSPLAYWRVGDPAGSLSAVNEVGSGDGTYLNGAAPGAPGLVLGDADTAAEFDGEDDYVDTTFSFDPSAGSFSIEALFDIDVYQPANSLAVVQQLGESGRTLMYVQKDTGVIGNFFGGAPRDSGVVAQADTTYHVIFAYDHDAGTYQWYVNGQVEGSGSVSAEAVNDVIRIGAGKNPDNSQHFDGVIDEVAVYGAALDADQAASHYAASIPEPASMTLLAMASLGILTRRRRM